MKHPATHLDVDVEPHRLSIRRGITAAQKHEIRYASVPLQQRAAHERPFNELILIGRRQVDIQMIRSGQIERISTNVAEHWLNANQHQRRAFGLRVCHIGDRKPEASVTRMFDGKEGIVAKL